MDRLDGVALTVIGATGKQGGATARAAAAEGASVRAVVRNVDSPQARALADLGIELSAGDLDDGESLARAFEGADGVFSALLPQLAEPDRESQQAQTIVDAAVRTGVRHLVHTSVSSTGWRTAHPDYTFPAGSIEPRYWDAKENAEQQIRDSDIDTWTILKPAYFMDNFLAPDVHTFFPEIARGRLAVATGLDVSLPLIACEDIGFAAAAVFAEPDRFAAAEVELAGDALTFPQIAAVLATSLQRTVEAVNLSPAELVASGIPELLIPTQLWWDEINYIAKPAHAKAFGMTLKTFAQWAEQHLRELRASHVGD